MNAVVDKEIAGAVPRLAMSGISKSFGGVAVLPVHPRPNAPAIRVLVRAIKGDRSPLAMQAGLELNDAAGRPSAAAEEILRGGAALPLASL